MNMNLMISPNNKKDTTTIPQRIDTFALLLGLPVIKAIVYEIVRRMPG